MSLEPLASSALLPAPSSLRFAPVDRADPGPNPHGDRTLFLWREPPPKPPLPSVATWRLSKGGSTPSGPALVLDYQGCQWYVGTNFN